MAKKNINIAGKNNIQREPRLAVLQEYEDLIKKSKSKIWDEYKMLKKYIFSFRYNIEKLNSHLNSIHKNEIMDYNNGKRWRLQRITHCLIGNTLTSIQSINLIFNSNQIQKLRNDNLAQLIRIIRNYHIHKIHVDTILNKSLKNIDDQIIQSWEENIDANKFSHYLKNDINETSNEKEKIRKQKVLNYVRSNFEKNIPLISLIQEISEDLLEFTDKHLRLKITQNDKELLRLFKQFKHFVMFKESLDKPNMFYSSNVKLRYLELGKSLIIKN